MLLNSTSPNTQGLNSEPLLGGPIIGEASPFGPSLFGDPFAGLYIAGTAEGFGLSAFGTPSASSPNMVAGFSSTAFGQVSASLSLSCQPYGFSSTVFGSPSLAFKISGFKSASFGAVGSRKTLASDTQAFQSSSFGQPQIKTKVTCLAAGINHSAFGLPTGEARLVSRVGSWANSSLFGNPHCAFTQYGSSSGFGPARFSTPRRDPHEWMDSIFCLSKQQAVTTRFKKQQVIVRA